jgi:hypothetical protein
MLGGKLVRFTSINVDVIWNAGRGGAGAVLDLNILRLWLIYGLKLMGHL